VKSYKSPESALVRHQIVRKRFESPADVDSVPLDHPASAPPPKGRVTSHVIPPAGLASRVA